MPFDVFPTTIFEQFAIANGNVQIPVASLGLTEAQASDSRKLLLAILEKYVDKITALPATDRPTRMTVIRSASSGQPNSILRQPYTVTVDLIQAPNQLSIASEP